MIHNNYRKMVKRRFGAGGTNSILIYDYTDIYGYTGNSDDVGALYLNTNPIIGYQFNNSTVNDLLGFKVNSDANSLISFILIGNSTNDEHDYTLGNILSNNLKLNCVSSREYDLLIATTITNTGNTDITFNEIGLFAHQGRTGASSVTSKYLWNGEYMMTLLLIKEVLSQPMTIPANSSVTITFNLFGDVTVSS